MTDLASTGAYAVIPTKVDGIYIRPLTRTLLNKHDELFEAAIDANDNRNADESADQSALTEEQYKYEFFVIGEIGCDVDGNPFANVADYETFKAWKHECVSHCKATMDAIAGAIGEALGWGKG